MTSSRNSAASDRTLRGFVTRRPEWFAVLVSLAYMLPQLALRFVAPEAASITATWNPVQLAAFAWTVLIPTALLTVLGWWGAAGFTRRSTWRSLVPLLPLILVYGVLFPVGLPALLGVASHSLGYFILVAVGALAQGFGDEATFRGVVLQTLMPRGMMRAVIISSVLYGAQYIGVIAAGVDPIHVAAQALHMVGMGIAFAAVVVVTRTIWPLVFIDTASLIPTLILPAGTSSSGIVGFVIELVLGALAAAYGLWLLRRHRRVVREGLS